MNNICPLESAEQQLVVSWANYAKFENYRVGDFLFAIPNGGSRRKAFGKVSLEAIRMKKEGIRAGVPDLMLAIASENFHGLFIEMKRKIKSKSRVSDSQKEWHSKLKFQGYMVVVAYGADEAIMAIKKYLGI